MTDLAAAERPVAAALADHADRIAPPRGPAPTPLMRLGPTLFAHARIAMLTVTGTGLVVDVNASAADLFGRPRAELVQDPLDRHLTPAMAIGDCLLRASHVTDATSFGPCTVRRRGAAEVVMELVVSGGGHVSGRDIFLVQLVP